MFPKYKTSLENQRITFKDAVSDYEAQHEPFHSPYARRSNPISTLAGILVGIAIVTLSVKSCHTSPQPAVKPIKTSSVFQRMTSHVAASTAMAIVMHSKYPRTLTAIAAVETGKRGKITTKGDSGRSRGIFQVQRKHWGHEGDSLEAQVKKADWVFDQLVKEHGYRGAVKAWNGSGRQAEKYRSKVFAKLEQMK